MAKMHTRKHGKARSRKPEVAPNAEPEWLTMKREEVLEQITSYAKQGMHQAMIGQMLKEKYGVLYIKQLFGKRLGEILKEINYPKPLPQDLLDLIKKAVNMREHIAVNKKDEYNKLRLQRVESKIWRLTKYYKKKGVLPPSWVYEPSSAALLIKGM